MAKVSVRNRNEGKLTKDGKKKPANWEYRIELAKVGGKRQQISKSGFSTKKEAETEGAKALAKYSGTGTVFTPSDTSYSDFLDYWFDNYVMMNCKYHTQQAYRQIIDYHLKPVLGSYRLKSLTPTVLQDFINQKVVSGLKKSTLTNILSVINGSLKYAVVPAQMLEHSPAIYVSIPKVDKAASDRSVISVDDFDRILDRFEKGNPFRYALLIGFYTGLRIGEVYGLTWKDIDFEAKTITVDKIVYKRNFGVESRRVIEAKGKKEEKCGWYIGTPKTKKSYRTIKIGDTLLKELREFHTIQLRNRLEYGEYYTFQYLKEEKDDKGYTIHRIVSAEASLPVSLPKTEFVFVKENGELQTIDSFKYASRVIHYDLGITFNFHSLRHTHATMLIEAGVSPKAVQERLGHENIKTTLQTYTHNTEQMEQGAVDTFEEAVKRKMPT